MTYEWDASLEDFNEKMDIVSKENADKTNYDVIRIEHKHTLLHFEIITQWPTC